MYKKDIVFAIPCPDYLLTGSCNLDCKYCFEKSKDNKNMDSEMLKEYLSHNPCTSGFPFGGEPLLVLDKLIDAIRILEENTNIPKDRKKLVLDKHHTIISNGILVPKLIEKIKKHGFKIQFSVDGCKEAHDKNRVYPNGSGSFDDVMKGVQVCIDNNIEWSCHGVVNKGTLPYIFESFKWFFNIYKENKKNGLAYAIDHLRHNTFQIIFEDDYDDKDVDILIEQFGKIAEWVWNHPELNEEQKYQMFDNWFFKTGGVCGVGTGLMALDNEMEIYPCHRVVFIKEEQYSAKLGNVFDPEGFRDEQFNTYCAFHKLAKRRKYMYSVLTQIHNFKDKDQNAWFMWCPATNLHETGNPYFQPVKYNLMFTELNRFIRALRLSYFGKRRPSYSGIGKCDNS